MCFEHRCPYNSESSAGEIAMKKSTSFKFAAFGLLLGAASSFATIPATVWHTNDTNYFDMWNKTNLDTTFFWPHASNWGVRYPGTDSAMITTDGLAQTAPSWNNLVWKWQSDPSQANFELRFSYHMVANPSGNSGFNTRGHCGAGTIATQCGGAAQGYKVFGPQIDLGPTYTGDVWNSGAARYATGISACKLTGTAWQDLATRISRDTVYELYYPSGFNGPRTVCASYFYTAATDVAATSPGLIALQYETTLRIEFKNIQIRNLNAVPVALNAGEIQVFSHIAGGIKSITYSVLEAGAYAIQVTDFAGKTVQSIRGNGPVSNQSVQMDKPGVYIVKMSAQKQSGLKKVYVR